MSQVVRPSSLLHPPLSPNPRLTRGSQVAAGRDKAPSRCRNRHTAPPLTTRPQGPPLIRFIPEVFPLTTQTQIPFQPLGVSLHRPNDDLSIVPLYRNVPRSGTRTVQHRYETSVKGPPSGGVHSPHFPTDTADKGHRPPVPIHFSLHYDPWYDHHGPRLGPEHPDTSSHS